MNALSCRVAVVVVGVVDGRKWEQQRGDRLDGACRGEGRSFEVVTGKA